MSGFIVGADRNQATVFPESLDDYVAEESAVRLIDVFYEPGAVEPSAGEGSGTQHRADVADRTAGT
jgi:hypothetical protein